jgi:hypothetical protein
VLPPALVLAFFGVNGLLTQRRQEKDTQALNLRLETAIDKVRTQIENRLTEWESKSTEANRE